MLRAVIIVSLALTCATLGTAAADGRPVQVEARVAAPAAAHDRFVVTSDECGASRFAHLVGREYAQVYQAALLPADSIVQNRTMLRTLEYTPHKLNVVVGAEGRIVAIGCF